MGMHSLTGWAEQFPEAYPVMCAWLDEQLALPPSSSFDEKASSVHEYPDDTRETVSLLGAFDCLLIEEKRSLIRILVTEESLATLNEETSPDDGCGSPKSDCPPVSTDTAPAISRHVWSLLYKQD